MFGYFFILFIDLILKSKSLCLGSVRKVCRKEGGRRILQTFPKKFRTPGDDRPKYFMVQ